MISIFILSIKTYSLAKSSNPGFLYCILAEVKIHYTQHGGIFLQVRYSTSTRSSHGAFTCYDVSATPSSVCSA